MRRFWLITVVLLLPAVATAHAVWPALTADQWREMTPERLQAHLAAGVSPNARDGSGLTALMRAAQYSADAAVLETLLAAGADVHARDEGGWTALMRAASMNPSRAVVDVLLRAGADVNARNMAGFTPLLWAAWRNENVDILVALLEGQANPHLRTRDGRSVVDLLTENPSLKNVDITGRQWKNNGD